MAVTVYADVLFFRNFFMDTILLYFTAQLSRAVPRPLRIGAAAAVLALYGTLVFVPSVKMLYSILGRVAAGMLAVWMLRLPGGRHGFFKGCILFFMVSSLCGGVVYALVMGSHFGQTLHAVSVNGSIYIPTSLTVLIPAVAAAYFCIVVFRKITIRNFSRDRILVPFSLLVGGQRISFTALLDTGCELTAPLSGEGVLLLSRETLRGLRIPQQFTITMHTAGGYTKITAFYPEEIHCLSEKYDLAETPLIGVVNQRFAADDLYRGIFHPKILRQRETVRKTPTVPCRQYCKER